MPKLTDLSLKNLAAPDRGQVTYDDEGSPLKVRVSQGGAKTFIIIIGSGRRHTIGRYGDITLQQARAAAVRLKAEKTLGRTFPEIISLEAARAEYLSQITVRPNTREYYVRHLAKLKGPRLTDVTPRDINRILDPLPIPSRMQALASFRPFFNWCVGRSYLDRSPCERLTAQPSPARDRVLSANELKSIWEATAEPKPYNGIVRVLILTGQRKGEIAALQTAWIKDGTITLPKEVTKNATGACAADRHHVRRGIGAQLDNGATRKLDTSFPTRRAPAHRSAVGARARSPSTGSSGTELPPGRSTIFAARSRRTLPRSAPRSTSPRNCSIMFPAPCPASLRSTIATPTWTRCARRSTHGKSACPLSSPSTIPTIPTPHNTPERHPNTYIRWQKGWQKPFPPLRDDKTLIPRQFAMRFAPDPIAFLLPIGHQRATRSA